MNNRIVAGSTVLLAWCLTSAPPLAATPGPGHTVRSSPGQKMRGTETPKQLGGRDLAKGDTNEFPEGHELGLAAAGRAFRHAMGSVAGVVRRPRGWDKGKKTGWDGGSVPPGLAKKQSLPSKFVHRAMFFRGGEGVFAGPDITRPQVANFDRFLDLHPGLDRSLIRNPSLINNEAFLAAHPPLAAWLRAHPQTAEELRENPRAFMRVESRFERSGSDITRGELARFDNFLDSHPVIARQLAINPALINNRQYLQQHAQLLQFLQTHPGIREELRENPQAFLERERRFDAFEARFPRVDEDINRQEIARFDRFLDANPSLAASLSRNPALINNSAFLAANPSLATWLKAHPEAAEELRENPQGFLNLVHRFDARGPEESEALNNL